MKKRAVCYCRCPADGQPEAMEWIDRLKAQAMANGCEVVDILLERKVGSGRPVLRCLLDQACAGEFGAILVPGLSHLSRDSEEFLRIHEFLQQYGIRVISAKGEDAEATVALLKCVRHLG